MEYDRYSHNNHLDIEYISFISRRSFKILQNLVFVNPISKEKIDETYRNE